MVAANPDDATLLLKVRSEICRLHIVMCAPSVAIALLMCSFRAQESVSWS